MPRCCSVRVSRLPCIHSIHNTTGGVPPDYQSPTAIAFEPARRALRAAHLCLVAVGLLYYEAAVFVQHLDPPLSKRIADLTDAEVCSFSVLGSSALARSFAAIMAEARNQTDGGASIAATPFWIDAPSVSDSFVHVVDAVANNRSKCPMGSTADYVVSFASIAAGAFEEHPRLCKKLEVVTTAEVQNDFNAGWLLSAAGVNAGPASRTPAGAALRRFAGYIDRDLRLELRARSVLLQGRDVLSGLCGRNQPRVHAAQLSAPLALAVGVPAAIAVILALVYPALLSLLGDEGRRALKVGAGGAGSGWELPVTAPDRDGTGGGCVGRVCRSWRPLRSRRGRRHRHADPPDIADPRLAPPGNLVGVSEEVDGGIRTGAMAPAHWRGIPTVAVPTPLPSPQVPQRCVPAAASQEWLT